ncbi:MAG: DUF1549 and DUF1553 domain-containing protein [Planctomycetes bacterium]|nr:DUF1549 and DUF1553 domain-containing protein [Planctomycetota bacterium]
MTRTVPRRLATCALAALFATVTTLPAPARDDEDGDEAPTQLINRVLAATWKKNNVTPPRRTTDPEFARKLYPDLIGRAPTAKEIAALEADKAADKREKLIDQLLSDNAWAEHQAKIWTNSLIPAGYKAASKAEFRKWLTGRLVAGTPYTDIVTSLLASNGKTSENGAVHFILANLGAPVPAEKRAEYGQFDMIPLTGRTGRVFLGQGFQCLACHNHPFEASLRQRDFWGVNAFFRQAERVVDPGDATVFELKDSPKLNPDGVVKFQRRTGFWDATGMNFTNGRGPRAEDFRSRRTILAEFVLKNKNFAPVAVNRTWTNLFGRGMLENGEFDDLGDYNEPLHPELLSGLASAFATNGYDQKKLVRWICNSDVYQLHATPTDDDDPNFFRIKKTQPLAAIPFDRCTGDVDDFAP